MERSWADGASRDTQCRRNEQCSMPKHSPGSPSCQSPTNWRMGRRGALYVEETSTAQCQNTPQGVHPASHLQTGGWGVESTCVPHVDFPGTGKGPWPHHNGVTWQRSPNGRGTQTSRRRQEHGKDEQQSVLEGDFTLIMGVQGKEVQVELKRHQRDSQRSWVILLDCVSLLE
jgi:hypothetical protein